MDIAFFVLLSQLTRNKVENAKNKKQVAQRHPEVSGTLALLYAVVPRLGVGRAVDPIGNDEPVSEQLELARRRRGYTDVRRD